MDKEITVPAREFFHGDFRVEIFALKGKVIVRSECGEAVLTADQAEAVAELLGTPAGVSAMRQTFLKYAEKARRHPSARC